MTYVKNRVKDLEHTLDMVDTDGPDRLQISFDPLEYMDEVGMGAEEARKAALRDRLVFKKRAIERGHRVYLWTLTGQLRQYRGWNEPDGRVRNVYYINVYKD